MCVWLCVCVYVCSHVCEYLCVCMSVHAQVCVSLYVCICVCQRMFLHEGKPMEPAQAPRAHLCDSTYPVSRRPLWGPEPRPQGLVDGCHARQAGTAQSALCLLRACGSQGFHLCLACAIWGVALSPAGCWCHCDPVSFTPKGAITSVCVKYKIDLDKVK